MRSQVALVTGASGGLGAAIASRLAAEGYFVLLHYRTPTTRTSALIDEIEAEGGRAASVEGNFQSSAGVADFLQRIDAALHQNGFEKLDVLIDNAGVGGFADISDTNEAMFDEIVVTNLKGIFFITQGALTRMKNGGRTSSSRREHPGARPARWPPTP